MRLLHAFEFDGHVLELKYLALEIDFAGLQALLDDLESLGIDLGRLLRVHSEIADLVRRGAAPESDFQAPAAHLVEHADFLENAQRMAYAKRVDQRAKAQAFGTLGYSGQHDAGRRRHAERRRVMLGDMVGVKSAAIVDFGELEPALIEIGKARIAAIDMIEDPEFHGLIPFSV